MQHAATVESVKIIMDRDTGRPRGFGFVEVATDEEAKKAIEELNEKELDGRPLIVKEAVEKERKPFRPNNGGNFNKKKWN